MFCCPVCSNWKFQNKRSNHIFLFNDFPTAKKKIITLTENQNIGHIFLRLQPSCECNKPILIHSIAISTALYKALFSPPLFLPLFPCNWFHPILNMQRQCCVWREIIWNIGICQSLYLLAVIAGIGAKINREWIFI